MLKAAKHPTSSADYRLLYDYIRRRSTHPHARSFELNADTRLFEESVLDSFGMLELMAFVEQRFGIPFKKSDLKPARFRTIRSILELIRAKREGARA